MASITQTIGSKIVSIVVKRFRVVTIIWLIILFLIGFLFLILPKWNNIRELGLADYQTEIDRLHKKEDYLKQITEMAKAYNLISETEIDQLSRVLPKEEDFAGLFAIMDQLAKQSGFDLASIDITKEQPQAAKSATSGSQEEGTAGQSAASQKKTVTGVSSKSAIQSLGIAVSLTGNSDYGKFKNFLENLESNLRLMDASTLSFSAMGATGGAVSTGGFSVNLRTYYLASSK